MVFFFVYLSGRWGCIALWVISVTTLEKNGHGAPNVIDLEINVHLARELLLEQHRQRRDWQLLTNLHWEINIIKITCWVTGRWFQYASGLTTYYPYKKNATSTQQSSFYTPKLCTLNSSHAAQLFAKLYGCICSHTVVNRHGWNHFQRVNVNENLLSSDACVSWMASFWHYSLGGAWSPATPFGIYF